MNTLNPSTNPTLSIMEKIAGHEQVVFCNDPVSGLQAIIAIHDTTLGPALGGCRMAPYASVDEALANLNKANDNFIRQKNLYKTKSTSQESYTISELNYNLALASLNKAKAAYELMKNGYRNEDIKIQEEKIKALKAQKEKLEIDIKDSVITSPVNGVILTRYKEIGSIATSGEAILEIAKNDEFWVRAYIDEKNLGDIKPGLKMQVFSDSRNEPYEGYIGFISPIAEFTPKNIETQELRADLVYSFRVIIKNSDDKLRQGMPVTLQIAKNNASN